MARQGFVLQLTRYDERGWRATFYTTGMEHSPASATGTGWERTPWHATQRAAWEALRKGLTMRSEHGQRLALVVVPGLPLGIPGLEAVGVKTKRSPSIRANQAHPVGRCYREPASIAGVTEAVAVTVPKLNRAVTRKAAIFDPVPNELSNNIWNHS